MTKSTTYRGIKVDLDQSEHWIARGWWWSHPDLDVVFDSIDVLLDDGHCIVINHALRLVTSRKLSLSPTKGTILTIKTEAI